MTPRLLQWISRLIAVPLLLFVVVEAAFGIWLHRRTSTFLDTAVRAVGEVVELRENFGGGGGGGGGTTWSPVFMWTDAGGEEHRSSSSFSSNPPSHEVGDPIDLLYDPVDPGDVRVDGFASLWLGPAVLLGLAAIQSFFVILFGLALPWVIGRFWKPGGSPRSMAMPDRTLST